MRILMLALLLCGTAGAQTAPMYRTVAPDGTVTFSDLPLSDQSEMITVLVRAGTTRSQSGAGNAAASDDAESLAAEMAENCTRAQEQQRSIANSTRLYRVLPSGERQFLTDEEIAEAREKAAEDVAQWCQTAG
jgi:hypothetical protein